MKISIYAAMAVLLTLSSCSQEGPSGARISGDGNRIYFRSYLPTVSQTRAEVISQETLTECRVTSINPDDNNHPATGEMTPYFSDISFQKDGEGNFLPEDEESCMWPDTRSRLHFFAYYPSAEKMQENINEGKFNLANHSEKTEDGTHLLDYRLEKFQVAPDIADHVDFIAAYANGTGKENGESGIQLDFSHRLARIEIGVWGDNDKYDFEIAGVRIGNALTEGDFCFSSLMSAEHAGEWLATSQSAVEHIYTEGESTVLLSKDSGNHTSKENAASIMGDYGTAMVIPMAEKIEAWEGKDDPDIDNPQYSTNKLYFSVLLRVTNRKDGTVVYPYPNDLDSIPTVYLTVGEDGKVSKRVYLIDDEYYTANQKDDELKFTETETEKVHAFCWASIPVGAKWEAGKIYTYKLNYSYGIGWHDPYGPIPGEPIIERGMIPFEVEVENWLPAEDYHPNLDVPKR
ncbi:MAG: fimbrillin family protein [Muribaculaceae bacterium]|nr:fimbrillin family protein [Muribaculaceae bacterium]